MRELAYMLFRNVLLLIFSLYLSVYSAQSKPGYGSLLERIKNEPDDTTKIKHLNELSWELKQINPDSAIIMGNQALALSEKIKWKKGQATSLGYLGVFNYFKGNYPEALDYYAKAIKVDDELIKSNDPAGKIGKARRLANIGTAYMEQGNYAMALEYDFKALKMEEELGNKTRTGMNCGNIGIVYWHSEDFSKALNYMFKALKTVEELGNKDEVARNLGNIGTVYNDWGRSLKTPPEKRDSFYNKALDYFLKALTMDAAVDDKRGISVDFGNIGNVYFLQENYEQALIYYQKSLEISKGLGDKTRNAIQLGNMSSVYILQEKYKEAEKCLMEALQICKEAKAMHHELTHEINMTELYSKTGNYKLAFEHSQRVIALKDSLFNEEKNSEITRHEMNYEFKKKEDASRAEQEKKDAITRIILFSVSGGFLLLFVTAGFIYRSYRQKKKANVIITNQKRFIEEKQKEIVDSIYYAKRIQKAHLPNEKYISKKMNDLKSK